MPMLVKLEEGRFILAEDPFTAVADDEPVPQGDVIISLRRFQSEGDQLLSQDRSIGVLVAPGEEVEALAYDLPRLAVVALSFPGYRDGRGYTSAHLLRERLGFTGQVRAVGEVLREQAEFMVRCGIDAFVPADGSTPEQWAAAVERHRHVYQRGADGRAPAFVERGV